MKKQPTPRSAQASKKVITFNALLRELFPNNHAEAKAGILSGYEVKSTLDLTEYQLDEAVAGLQAEKSKRGKEAPPEIRGLRSKCLNAMTDIGVKTSDWAKVNKFCEQPRMLNGKRLYDLSKEELEAFHRKLLAVKAAYKSREQDEKFYAINN